MSSHKSINLICAFVTICAILLTVLFMNGEALGIQVIVDEDAEGFEGTEYFTANDLDTGWDDEGATRITLNGTDAEIDGSGAYTYEGNVVISTAGYYVLSGTLTDGFVTVDAYQSSKVFIRFDGVDLSCSDDAAFRVDQAEKVFVTLAEGTKNTVTSGALYSDSALQDNTGGAVFSRDDLTINGSGELVVTASYKHGIDCNDSLHITGGTISVSAPEDALHVNDSVRLTDCALTLYAGDDGIHCDREIIMADGSVTIAECYEGFEAPEITIEGGDIAIYPTDDGFNANGGTSSYGGLPADAASTATTEETYEGTPFILINGGSILIVNESARDADGLDSNGDIFITGGDIRVSLSGDGTNSAIDYGSESGGVCEISGGTVIACGSYSMAEHFDETSTQCSVLYNFTETAEAGTVFALENADEEVILSWEVPCSFSSVNVSCPELSLDETYIVAVGNNAEEITVESVSASYGDAASNMFRGAMGQGGGMRQRGNRTAPGEGESAPEGMENMGTPPDMPEGMENMGTPPDMPEGMENMGTPPDMAESTETTAAVTETVAELSGTVRIELIASMAVLLAGMVMTLLYRRRKEA